MPELGTSGSVRGVPGNGHPYRDRCAARTGQLAVDNAMRCPPRRPSPTSPTASNHYVRVKNSNSRGLSGRQPF